MSARTRSARHRVSFLAAGLATLCTMLSVTASAQVQNKMTTVTFSAPVEIPGVGAQVLPAGTYVFRILDTLSDRNVVQILNKDQSHVYATILAIPNYRLKATDRTVMTFAERAAGDPQAIRAWFYPGENWGQEFVYPKTKAVELAKASQRPVLYVPDEMATNITAPVTTANEPAVVALREAPVRAVTPSGDDATLSAVIAPPPVMAAARLPKTASSLPLVALMGVLCLGIAVSVRSLCAR